ncbi:MAG: TRAP transporter small permease [Pseudomonadota bacterium]
MKPIEKTNRLLLVLAGLCLAAMCLLTCANIFLRAVWKPIPGAYELMGLFCAVATAFALGHTRMQRGHIAVDVLVNTFRPGLRRLLQVINNGACTIFFGLAAWQLTLKALVLMRSGEITETLRIIYYPFTIAVAMGCAFLALVMAADLVGLLRARAGKAPK